MEDFNFVLLFVAMASMYAAGLYVGRHWDKFTKE